jgi:hypothetical protein
MDDPGYVKTDKVNGNIDYISGREIEKGICLTCYNKIFKAAYNKFMEIQKESINDHKDELEIKNIKE